MKYKDILKQLACQEKTTITEIEKEMQVAIDCAGLDCSVKEFIELSCQIIKEKTIYNNIV